MHTKRCYKLNGTELFSVNVDMDRKVLSKRISREQNLEALDWKRLRKNRDQ